MTAEEAEGETEEEKCTFHDIVTCMSVAIGGFCINNCIY
jgi:hypothetical protein